MSELSKSQMSIKTWVQAWADKLCWGMGYICLGSTLCSHSPIIFALELLHVPGIWQMADSLCIYISAVQWSHSVVLFLMQPKVNGTWITKTLGCCCKGDLRVVHTVYCSVAIYQQFIWNSRKTWPSLWRGAAQVLKAGFRCVASLWDVYLLVSSCHWGRCFCRSDQPAPCWGILKHIWLH